MRALLIALDLADTLLLHHGARLGPLAGWWDRTVCLRLAGTELTPDEPPLDWWTLV